MSTLFEVMVMQATKSIVNTDIVISDFNQKSNEYGYLLSQYG